MSYLGTIIQKLAILAISTGLSLLVGGIIVTPLIALAYYRAQDGPIFPAPMVAFVVVAPISFILFILQGLVIIYEWITKHRLKNLLIWIGVVSGLVAGLIPYLIAIAPFQSSSDSWAPFAFAGLGIFLGLTAFGFHWIANKLLSILQNSKSTRTIRILGEHDDQV